MGVSTSRVTINIVSYILIEDKDYDFLTYSLSVVQRNCIIENDLLLNLLYEHYITVQPPSFRTRI